MASRELALSLISYYLQKDAELAKVSKALAKEVTKQSIDLPTTEL